MSNKNLGKLSAECVLKGKLNFPVAEDGTDTSDATAIAYNILDGRIAYVKGEKIVGTMPSHEEVTVTPSKISTSLEGGFYPNIKFSGVTADIDSNITPMNIKQGVSILGVEGALNTGVDTYDADATAMDIAEGSSAYVKGAKIQGTLPSIYDDFTPNRSDIELEASSSIITLSYINEERQILEEGVAILLSKNASDIAEAIGLTADKIKAGEIILGVMGTYTGE